MTRIAAAALLLSACLCPTTAPAGGGPENVFLVVNPASGDSLAVANAYVALRGIPAANVLLLPWAGGDESTTIARFRGEILLPILRAIEARRLAAQIDCIAYSAGFPSRIDFAAEVPAELRDRDRFPSASLTGLTMLYAAVQGGQPVWFDPASNDYFRPLGRDGVPTATQGFRGWYGWGDDGSLLEAGGGRYLLAAMLGVTAGRGNTVAEVAAYLKSAAAADGTRPKGTIYFMTSADVRTTTRSGGFPAAVRALQAAGVAAEILAGTLPVRKRDVAGLMAGTPSFAWNSSGSTILPGAICENLTSFGGVFTPSAGQTPLSEFLRAGAAGSSGTVIEPFSLQEKFPHPSIQVHYARGASLAEAFYQSVHAPYQLLVVGDPLCQPWAVIPEVEVVTAADQQVLAPGAVVSGTLELEPRATVSDGTTADRFELFVDGLRVAQGGPGDRLVLDTTAIPDGHHDLCVVAIAATSVETQGRRRVPIVVSNHGRSLDLSVMPRRVRPDGTVRVTVSGSNVEGAVVFATGRVLGRTTGPDASIDVPAALLGLGPVTIRATVRGGPRPADGVTASPVDIEVTPAP
jgi:hypothetical protein